MKAYDSLGVYSFNMNFFAGRKGDRHARFHLLFSPRTFFNQALGTTDVGALRNLYNESHLHGLSRGDRRQAAAVLRG